MISTLISDGRIAWVELGNINNNAFWICQYWRDSEIDSITLVNLKMHFGSWCDSEINSIYILADLKKVG